MGKSVGYGDGRDGILSVSAMANKYLDKTIDIHSGGQDLIFPHHENEIAQSEAQTAVSLRIIGFITVI